MRLPPFEYVTVSSPGEAISAWAGCAGAIYLAGGTDLLPQMRAGRKAPARVIGLTRIRELGGIRDLDDGGVAIGAAVPMSQIEIHGSILARFPILAECIRTVGAPPLRNLATLAGNICNASPAADTAIALLALDASVAASGPAGARTIPIGEFFAGPGRSVLQPGELVTEITLPGSALGFRGSYLRLSRRQGMDLATVGVLVARRTTGGTDRHRVVLAAVAPTPLRVRESEAVLDRAGAGATGEAAAIARDACSPITDIRGSAEYRREMVGVLARRGLAALQ